MLIGRESLYSGRVEDVQHWPVSDFRDYPFGIGLEHFYLTECEIIRFRVFCGGKV